VCHQRLHQHCISLVLGAFHRIQVGWGSDADHPPDFQTLAAESCGVSPGIVSVELGSKNPARPCYSEDLVRRLCGKNPEDGNAGGGGDNFPGTAF
jgi:hypothetical protein